LFEKKKRKRQPGREHACSVSLRSKSVVRPTDAAR
jgi:hypothetical protein